MKVTISSLTEDAQERRDYRNAVEIEVDGKKVFSAWDGEPEDATLSRDFSDCWGIPDLMKMAHQAGAEGKEFIIESFEKDEM